MTMTQRPLTVYVATYASMDLAADDLACVRRLERDGIITPDDSTVIARDAGDLVVRRDAARDSDAVAQGQQAVDRVLDALFAPVHPSSGGSDVDSSGDRDGDPTPAWLLEDDVQDLQEQLAPARAAVVVVGGAEMAAILRVALARATSMLAVNLTVEGARLACPLPVTAAVHAWRRTVAEEEPV